MVTSQVHGNVFFCVWLTINSFKYCYQDNKDGNGCPSFPVNKYMKELNVTALLIRLEICMERNLVQISAFAGNTSKF